MNENMYKLLVAMVGGLVGLISPIVPLIIVCYLFIIADVVSAYQLGKRVTAKAKEKGLPVTKDSGKFKTAKAKVVIKTMTEVSVLILLTYLLDTKVLSQLNGLFLANYAAGIVCLLQLWSILENSSSCKGSRWAKLLQKIMVNKAERHFDINLEDLKKDEKA